MLESGVPVQIIDSRPRQYTTRTAADIMEGAVWRDPELIDDWMGELSKTDPVVAYCVYGSATGCQIVLALRKAGFNASYMTSGHYGWKAIGGKVRLFE
jgi:Fe-Mn family superoxide dismutase